jgi:drug/metabolite transporter (DMT)-like permease
MSNATLSDTKNLESTQNNPMLGIALKVASVCAFTAMAVCIKFAGQFPPGQLVFFRSFCAIMPIIAYLLATHQFAGVFRTKHLGSHIMRGAVGVSAMGLGFYGLTRIPLPDAIALSYARPLIIVALGAIILGETVGRYRWGAVCVGLVGVMIISWPKLELLRGDGDFGNQQALGALATLGHALIASFAYILVRKLITSERTPTIVLYFSITASAFGLATLPFGWEMPNGWQWVALISSGFFGGLGQILVTQSYRYAETGTLAPFEYTSVVLSLVLGIWLFSEIPTSATLLGSAIVVAAGIFIIYREHTLGLKRAAIKKASPGQGL